MKILIIGANGKVGKLIVQHLQKSDYQAVAMIRDKVQAAELEKYGAKIVVADLEQDFEHTYENVDVVVFTAGSGSKTGPDKTISVDQESAIKSVDLALKHNVKQYIMISAQGARMPELPSPIQHYNKAKAIADNYIINSGINYTIFRPGKLLDDKLSGKIQISTHIPEKGQTSRENLALTVVEAIDNKKTFGKVLEVFDGEVEIGEAF